MFATVHLAGDYVTKLRRVEQPPGLDPVREFNVYNATVPTGVFVKYENTKYYPTVHGLTEAMYHSLNQRTALVVHTSGSVSKPANLSFVPGSYEMLNTGEADLAPGDQFVVVYPGPTEIAAQKKCLNSVRAQTSIGSEFLTTVPLWGGFLATRKVPNDVLSMLADRTVRDLTTASRESLMDLGALLNAAQACQMNRVRHLGAARVAAQGLNAAPAVDLALTRRQVVEESPHLAVLARELGHFFRDWACVTVGECIKSVFANSDITFNGAGGKSSTGLKFYGILRRIDGL